MSEVRKKIRTVRAQNPFDDGAEERLRRMNMIHAEGTINKPALFALSGVYAGLFFDDLCDFHQDYSLVKDDLNQLFAAADKAESRQKFLLICLQYDGLSQPLPNPIWWISGNPELAGIFADAYPTLKTVCEGRELPAYEAATEFVSRTSSELDDLLSQLGGKQGALNTLEKLEQAEEKAANELSGLLEQLRQSRQDNPTLNDAVVKAANEAQSKHRQVEAVSKLIDASQTQNNASVAGIVEQALDAAAEKAEEVQSIIGAWSSEPGNLQRTPVNEAILERVRRSDTLRDISKYLGRFREIFAQGKHNGFAYGRGEKYSLELGNDLSRSLTSELAMLASPETLPLFLRKYQRKQIKQYRRREPIYKGAGDIICCLDESGSTSGELAAWGKAVALTLLEIAEDAGRKFALIHFSGPGSFKTDLFLPNQYGMEDKIRAAETFLDGGTDFQTPLNEAMRLMREDSFENADIVFITDGECELSESYIEELRRAQIEYRFTVTGVLLDQDNAGMDFSLKSFCQNTYRTSELTGEQVVQGIVSDRV